MNADQVKELLSNATPGEWRTSRKDMDSFTQGEDGKVDHVVYIYRGTAQPRVPVFAGPLDNAREDAALMAAAPAVAQWGLERAQEVARLREALRSVLEEAWDGYEVYTVEPETLKAAQEVLQVSEAKR